MLYFIFMLLFGHFVATIAASDDTNITHQLHNLSVDRMEIFLNGADVRPYVKVWHVLSPSEIRALNSLKLHQYREITIFDHYFPSNSVKEMKQLILEIKLKNQEAISLLHILQAIMSCASSTLACA